MTETTTATELAKADYPTAWLFSAKDGTPDDIFYRVSLGEVMTRNAAGIFVQSKDDQTGARIRIQNTGPGGRVYDFVGGVNNEGNVGLSILDVTANATRLRLLADGSFGSGIDDVGTFGTASHRWSGFFATNGAITTSDEREKLWRDGLTDAEYAAGREVFAELGFYQWTDEVDKKGQDSARFHFGARAQRVWSIFANHGLAPKIRKNGKPESGIVPPAFLCWDQLDDEFEDIVENVEVEVEVEEIVFTGQLVEVEGRQLELSERVTRKEKRSERRVTGQRKKPKKLDDRYGFRIDQLNIFLIAVQARRQDEQDVRLAALESAEA